VIHDDLSTDFRIEVQQTEGIGLSVAVGGELVETARVTWQGWDEVPATHEREKPALRAYEEVLRQFADSPVWPR
jgi:hypothetical protein